MHRSLTSQEMQRRWAAGLDSEPDRDLGAIRGQEAARRALEIAAAGSHHMLLIGSPGAGKTMLARALPSILPPPSCRGSPSKSPRSQAPQASGRRGSSLGGSVPSVRRTTRPAQQPSLAAASRSAQAS